MLNFINNGWNAIRITFTKIFNILKEPILFTMLFVCLIGFLISLLTMNILSIIVFIFFIYLCIELIEGL